jgi:hypothetical protein
LNYRIGVKYVTEENLSALAYRRIPQCKTNLTSIIASLENNSTLLQSRITTIDTSKPANQSLYKKMHETNLQVQQKLTELKKLHDCMQHHESYFTLFDEITSITAKYGNGTMPLRIPNGELYPTVTYIQKLDQDLASLRQIIQTPLHYRYPQQLESITAIISNLTQKKDAIVDSPVYTQELRLKDQAERKERHRQDKLAEQRRRATEEHRQRLLQQGQLSQQLRAQEKTNALLLLQQRLQAGTITPAQFEQEKTNIESSHMIQTGVDLGALLVGLALS